MPIPKELTDGNEWGAEHDWAEAIHVACRDGIESVPPGTAHRCDPFALTDVVEVIAAKAGENDGPNWVGVFRLHDGRFIALTAWCDYTGWG